MQVRSRNTSRGIAVGTWAAAAAAGVLAAAVSLSPAVASGSWAVQQSAQALLDRAVAEFQAGRIDASAAAFDELFEMLPDYAPQLWQRGIVLYYAGRYQDCREQFELHRTVNPNDVENATWHFLCVARSESPEAARQALLPVGPDPRVPMTEIYEMFRGDRTPEAVLAVSVGRPSAEFYAHLYIGLYYEALGREQEAIEHISLAAADHYAAAGGYMHMVARVHAALAVSDR